MLSAMKAIASRSRNESSHAALRRVQTKPEMVVTVTEVAMTGTMQQGSALRVHVTRLAGSPLIT